MSSNLEIRLTICLNENPVGPRLERKEPMPSFQHTYSNTPDGKKQAECDMERIRSYIIRNYAVKTRK